MKRKAAAPAAAPADKEEKQSPVAKRTRQSAKGAAPATPKKAATGRKAAAKGKAATEAIPAGSKRRTTKASAEQLTGSRQSGKAKAPAHGTAQQAEAAAPGERDVNINRAPVLTLWVAVVAERQGFVADEALTFGRYISGLLAHSKGKSLGMYEEHEKTEEEKEARRQRDREMGVQQVEVFGMKAPAVTVGAGGAEVRAVSGGKPIDPEGVQGYLERSFKEALEPTKAAMEALAAAIPADRIGRVCYKLYEEFRPPWSGWGQKGTLSLSKIRELAGGWQEFA